MRKEPLYKAYRKSPASWTSISNLGRGVPSPAHKRSIDDGYVLKRNDPLCWGRRCGPLNSLNSTTPRMYSSPPNQWLTGTLLEAAQERRTKDTYSAQMPQLEKRREREAREGGLGTRWTVHFQVAPFPPPPPSHI